MLKLRLSYVIMWEEEARLRVWETEAMPKTSVTKLRVGAITATVT
jgi:hypothetical protein